MDKVDLRVQRTKKVLKNTFKEMFLNMNLEQITVKSLCEKSMINRRTFYSRNRGIYNATGKYITIIDADDYIFNNILLKLYNISELYNLDILQYYMFIGDGIFKGVKYKDGILYQPQIKNNHF